MNYSNYDLNEDRRFVPQIRFEGGAGTINLMALKNYIQNKADSYGLPVKFVDGTLKTGGLLNKQTEPVLSLYNYQHPEYLGFMLRVTYHGTYAFLDVYKVGGSKNYKHENSQSSGRMLLNMMSGHKQKLQEEENYYSILYSIFQDM